MTASGKTVLDACCICFSPSVAPSSASVKACKQCTSFFRRTVSLKIDHHCIGNGKCAVHYGRRVVCKKCHFEKCLRNKMKSTRSCQSTVTNIDQLEGTSRSWKPMLGSSEEELPTTISHYTKMESDLNIRRKLLHTCPSLNDVFATECQTPYSIHNVNYYDYICSAESIRTDVAVLIDYIKGFPDFVRFTSEEKGVWYRYTAMLDYIMNGANYSVRIGVEHQMFVIIHGQYIKMDPPPISIEEAMAAGKFRTKVDENYYRTIVPIVLKQWVSVVLPMAKLKLSFEEFALLKALVCWQIGSTRFNSETKKLCDYNKNVIFEALLSVNSMPDVTPEERLGELVLFMGCVLEALYSGMDCVAMVSTFNLVAHDSLFTEIFDHKRW